MLFPRSGSLDPLDYTPLLGHAHTRHDHMGHGDEPMCNMNMLFTWDTQNLCIIFRSWRVDGTASLIGALIGVVLLTAGYELVREASRRYEAATQRRIDSVPRNADARNGDSNAQLKWSTAAQIERRSKLVKAFFYAVQVFYSFFIMLLFMTYNGWIMLAVAVGAFVGYLAFGGSSATKTVACH